MKNLINIIILSGSVLFLQSCTGNKPSSPQMESVKKGVDTWVISSFTDKGRDRTADFNGYTFSFEQPKNIISYHNGINETGIYREVEDDSVKKGVMVFAGTDPMLARLIDKWDIVESTPASLSLRRMRRNGMEEVHFIKGADTARNQ